MKNIKFLKTTIKTISIITMILLLSPIVFASSFQIVVPSLEETIRPGIEYKNVTGYTQLTPGPLDFFKGIWFYEYTEISVIEKPEWANIIIPESTILTPPDGEKHYFEILISVSEDAPAFEWTPITLNITTGKFIRIIFPNIPFFNREYSMNQVFNIQSGYLPLLTATNPAAIELSPNSSKDVSIYIKNTGNGVSILNFGVNVNDIPNGWSIDPPEPIYINPNEQKEAIATVYSPTTDGYIDEWASIPLDIMMMSVIEGESGPTQESTVSILAHCMSQL